MSKYPFAETMSQFLKRVRHTFEGVPLVAPIIPRTGGWTGDNQLGFISALKISARVVQTILKMDEWGPPVMWTISFDFNKRPEDDLIITDIVAQVELGVGGSTQTLLCDWSVGNQITVTANAVNVIALYRNVSLGVADDETKLSMQIARGSRASSGIAPVYTFAKNVTLAAIGVGNADRWDLPNFAKAVRIVPTNSTGTPGSAVAADVSAVFNSDVLIEMLDASNHMIAVMRATDLVNGAMPVIAGARFVEVLNNSASAIHFNMVAELAA